MSRVLKLGTRSSQLAMTQSNDVAELLRQLGYEVEIVPVHTQGDVNQASLKSLGGVGVFAAALRLALLAGDCDIAVHSFKDLPTAPVPGLMIGAVPVRADFADVLVCRDELDLESLPRGATVGTGSPRRAASVLALRPDLQIVDIRGNVGTRLGRVAGIDPEGRGDLDAVVVARAGLERLGSAHADAPILPALPAPAQGALAVEVRSDDEEVVAAVSALDDAETRACALAERAVLAGLQAGCAAPVGAYASLADDTLSLSARVLSTDGARSVELTSATRFHGLADRATRDQTAQELGLNLAQELLNQGAADVTDLAATKPTRASHEAPKTAQRAAGSGVADASPTSSTGVTPGTSPESGTAPAPGASQTPTTPQTPSRQIFNQSVEGAVVVPETASGATPGAGEPGDNSAGSADAGPNTTPTGVAVSADAQGENGASAAASNTQDGAESRWGTSDLPLGDTQRERPLTGRTVLMPRAKGDHLVRAVEDAGARVVAHPMTRTILTPSFDVKPSLKLLEGGHYTWCVITSPRTLIALACHLNGVRSYDEDVDMAPLAELLQKSSHAGTTFASLGETTTRALRDLGVEPEVSVGAKASQEELLAAFSNNPSCQYYARAWFPASSLARPFLADQWAKRGWEIDRAAPYTTAPIDDADEALRTAWNHGMLDAAVFTAGSNARAALEILGPPAETMKVVAFGDPSAKVCADIGLHVDAIAPTQNADGIIAALIEAFK